MRKIIQALLHPLGKLLAPLVNKPQVQAVLVPVCLVAGGLQYAWGDSPEDSWQGKVASAAVLVVTFCAAAGISSKGFSPPGQNLMDSGEHPAPKVPVQKHEALKQRDHFDVPKF